MRHSPIQALDAALSKLKLKDLHRLVTATGLVQTGTKAELLERLKPYIPETVIAAAAGGDDGGGVLEAKTKGLTRSTPKCRNGKKQEEKKNGGDNDTGKPSNEVRQEKKIGILGCEFWRKGSGLSRGNASVRRERILSIDMGIQNLAFCVVDVELGGSTTEMHVVAWRRLAPMSFLPSASASASASDSPTDRTSSALLYASSNLALAAQSLLTRTLLPYGPTTILIEKQRYRTQGFAAVQEWTLRVNTLEAALWGVLAALRVGKGFDTSGYMHQYKKGINGNHVIGSSEATRISQTPDVNNNQGSVLRKAYSDYRPTREVTISKEDPKVYAVSPGRVAGFWSAVLADYNEETGTSNDIIKPKRTTDKTIKTKRKSPTTKSERSGNPKKSPEQSKSHNNDKDNDSIESASTKSSQPLSPPQTPFKLSDKRAKVMLVKHWLTTGRICPFDKNFTESPHVTKVSDRNRTFYNSFSLSFGPDAQAARTAILNHGERRRPRPRPRRPQKQGDDKANGRYGLAGQKKSIGEDGNKNEDKNDNDDDNDNDSGDDDHDNDHSMDREALAGKLDDLADCMLQATAWARWKENEMVLRRGQWEKLLRGKMG